MTAADLRVDHVTVAGRDAAAVQKRLALAGFSSEFGGKHANHATEMAIVSFADGSYLELIGLQKDAAPTAVALHPWSKFMLADAGPCAWAVRASDVSAEVARLRGLGIAVKDKVSSGRTRPDGVRLDWETAQVGGGDGDFFPFLIRDLTPRERRAYPQGKPSAPEFTGVSAVVIAVRDLDPSIARYRKAYDLAKPEIQNDAAFGARMARFAGTPVILAAALDRESWLARRVIEFGEAPVAFVLSRGAAHPSTTHWLDERALGWRLGIDQ